MHAPTDGGLHVYLNTLQSVPAGRRHSIMHTKRHTGSRSSLSRHPVKRINRLALRNYMYQGFYAWFHGCNFLIDNHEASGSGTVFFSFFFFFFVYGMTPLCMHPPLSTPVSVCESTSSNCKDYKRICLSLFL